MAKSRKSKCVETPPAAKKLVERKLAGVNPRKEQFEPTEAAPVRQHTRMAGGG